MAQFDADADALFQYSAVRDGHQPAEWIQDGLPWHGELFDHPVGQIKLHGAEVHLLALSALRAIEGAHAGDVGPDFIGPRLRLQQHEGDWEPSFGVDGFADFNMMLEVIDLREAEVAEDFEDVRMGQSGDFLGREQPVAA